MLDLRGEEAQTGTCPAKCGSSHRREWDKAWNSAKGACLLWLEFRSYHRAGWPIVWASLFATFLAMKKGIGIVGTSVIPIALQMHLPVLQWQSLHFANIPGLHPGLLVFPLWGRFFLIVIRRYNR